MQGADIGSQYRSEIFYHSEEQKIIAEKIKNKWNNSGKFSTPIVTEISLFEMFYKAEDSHQDYYNSNSSQPYCKFVIEPKVLKFTKNFQEKIHFK